VPEGIAPTAIVKGNRIAVDACLRVNGHKNIFAVGDVAAVSADESGGPHPMVAPVAIQQGELVAGNLMRMQQKKAPRRFRYRDKGSMATIGRNKAVVDLPFLRFKGMVAWLVWIFVHLMSLVSYRNRLIVFINWMLSYFSYDKSIRLIIRPYTKPVKTPPKVPV
jgi:NADH:ubiquinone reductase (H+-translocating)